MSCRVVSCRNVECVLCCAVVSCKRKRKRKGKGNGRDAGGRGSWLWPSRSHGVKQEYHMCWPVLSVPLVLCMPCGKQGLVLQSPSFTSLSFSCVPPFVCLLETVACGSQLSIFAYVSVWAANFLECRVGQKSTNSFH